MVLRGALVIMLIGGLPAIAQAQDMSLADAPACRDALRALDARTAARAARSELEPLRRRAARACLGGPEAAASAPRARVQTPMPVPPVAPPAPRGATPAAVDVSPPRVAAPLTLGGCDPAGCWTSDGTRLQRVGPGGPLLGPNGLVCTVSGAQLHCPR
jgi:hypothetical protein